MKIMKLCGLVMLLLTIFITSQPDIAHTHAFRSMGSGLTGHINHVVRVSPRPPGWPQMWLARDIIKSFNENGLKIDQTGNVSEHAIDILHADIKDGVKFSIRSDEQIRSGCVLEFEKKKDFETIQGHYLDLNNNNELNTWSLVKDNILVVIDGTMSEKEIQAYKAVLMNIK